MGTPWSELRKKRQAAEAAAGPKRVISGRRTPNGTYKHAWIAPEDMPQWAVNLVKAGKICGARFKRGGWCERTPSPNQDALGRPKPHRCEVHGGATPVSKLSDAQRAHIRNKLTKFGPYSSSIAPGEEELFLALAKDSGLDHEIAITKLRLTRAVAAEMAQRDEATDVGEDDAERGHVEEDVTTTTRGPDGVTVQRRISRRHVNPSRTVHAIVLELTKLLQAKAAAAGSTEVGPQEAARLAREALAQARRRMAGGKMAKPTEEKDDG